MVKVTFTLDEDTVRAIRRIAERRQMPQSAVVREAVAIHARQEEKLTAAARGRRLRVLDDLLSKPATRPQDEVAAELRDLRRSRRTGWGRPSD